MASVNEAQGMVDRLLWLAVKENSVQVGWD